jgi:hypothetical protein
MADEFDRLGGARRRRGKGPWDHAPTTVVLGVLSGAALGLLTLAILFG